jgi:hypothetical protein
MMQTLAQAIAQSLAGAVDGSCGSGCDFSQQPDRQYQDRRPYLARRSEQDGDRAGTGDGQSVAQSSLLVEKGVPRRRRAAPASTLWIPAPT